MRQTNFILLFLHTTFILMLLLFLLLPSIAPCQVLAATTDSAVLKWAIVDTPGSMADRNDIRSPCEVNAIVAAIDGKTFYAIDIPDAAPPPVPQPGLWKSNDGGISWSPKPTQHLAQAIPAPILPVMDIALAPDNPDLVAVVCLNNTGTLRSEVYFSEDGGSNWAYTGVIPWVYGSGEQIGDITISTGYKFESKMAHDIIVCSRHPSDGKAEGEIYVLRYPGIDVWKAQGFTSGDAIAIKCSPNYTADFSLVVMASTTQRTSISLGYRDVVANTSRWNIETGWPVELCLPDQSGGSSSGENKIITGEVVLSRDFLGASRERRVVFATYDSNSTAMGTSQVLDDVYHLNNTLVTRLKVPGCGINARISTIAYEGDSKQGKMLAGEVAADSTTAAARVWICLDPLLACPTWRLSFKQPTGGGMVGYANAQVAWLPGGAAALCATGAGNRDTPQKWADPSNSAWSGQNLDESAVSISGDNGWSWNQTGLIDTKVNRFKSVATAEDESTVYLASANDAGFDSLWRSQSLPLGMVWQRMMCFNGESSILRLAPESKDGITIFWGNQGTKLARRSTDSGQTWQECLPNVIIQDIAAADSQTLYVLQSTGMVQRGSYSTGWIWNRSIDSDLDAAHTIAVLGENILVGAAKSSSSPAAYSVDGGIIWTKIAKQTPTYGNRHVAFDTYFDDNYIIYLADDGGSIYRWCISSSKSWDELAPPNHSFYGLALGSWGTLYGAYNPNGSGVDRALYPRSGIPKPGIYWDSLTTGLIAGVSFSAEPNSLVISRRSLWAIDDHDFNPSSNRGCLWTFTDTLARARPFLVKPEEGDLIGYDPVSGRNQDVDLRWEQLSLANAYEILIGKDEDLSLRITEAEPATNPYYMPSSTTAPAYRITPGLLPKTNATYYWQVRVRQAATGQLIRSQWSDVNSFGIEAGVPVVSPYLGAQALSPNQSARSIKVSPVAFSWTPFQDSTEYSFVLAQDSAMKVIVVETTVPTTAYEYKGRLKPGSNYYWQVKATRPLPSEQSPVFSFTTAAEVTSAPAAQQVPDRLYYWLIAALLIHFLLDFIILTLLIIRRRQP